jgi:hypothetical protein
MYEVTKPLRTVDSESLSEPSPKMAVTLPKTDGDESKLRFVSLRQFLKVTYPSIKEIPRGK